jgi:hypothetical protein
LQAVDLLAEVALLLEVGGRPGCCPVRLKCGRKVASHLEEVAADGVEAAIGSGGDFAWQRFSATRRLESGDHRILARATDCRGHVQPQAGARNEIHTVSLRVRAGLLAG